MLIGQTTYVGQLHAYSHSEIVCYQRCPREHYYAYRLQIEPVTPAPALVLGTRVHAALANLDRGTRIAEDDWISLGPMGRSMVTGYQSAWAGSRLEIVDTEVLFVRQLPGMATKTYITGKFDAIAHDTATGNRVILERKTTSEDIGMGSTYWKGVVHCSSQATLYTWAAPASVHSSYLIWDVIKKPTIDRLSATPEENRKYRSDGQLYASQRAVDESEEEYEIRCLQQRVGDPGRFYRRSSIYRTEDHHAATLNGIRHVLRVINESGSRQDDCPQHLQSCIRNHTICPYWSICHENDSPHNQQQYKENSYAAERAEEIRVYLG